MANKENPRREGEKHTENGPRWENSDTDRNSARARTKWKRRANRSERRTGAVISKFQPMAGGGQDQRRHKHPKIEE